MDAVPEGSIYFWMYKQGLRQIDLRLVLDVLACSGKKVREKDFENYWNGWYRHELYRSDRDIMSFGCEPRREATRYSDYPLHPMMGMPEILNRWVPCNAEGKPIIKWSKGCMTKVDAMSMRGCETLAENMRGTKMIVIDCDGDHGDELDLETVEFLSQFRDSTHCMSKPKKCWEYGKMEEVAGRKAFDLPASYHLTFQVERTIPTMHFPEAHIDVIGNRANSLRYLKNKEWNGLSPAWMDDDTWDLIMGYIGRRSGHAIQG